MITEITIESKSSCKKKKKKKQHEQEVKITYLSYKLCTIVLKSLALCEESLEVELGIDRIPRTRRIKMMNVDVDADFVAGRREYFPFALINDFFFFLFFTSM